MNIAPVEERLRGIILGAQFWLQNHNPFLRFRVVSPPDYLLIFSFSC
ncbi:MAG TPA: hypothetical protein VFU49_07325 [Ktedonobacteraceae bacterium]|nr:hypothetical protein [Ktedonobacteraceae bacterium]